MLKEPSRKGEGLELEAEKQIKTYELYAQIGVIAIILGLIAALNLRAYEETYSAGVIGYSIAYIGVLILIFSLFSLALHAKKLHIYIRIALLITIGLIVGNLFRFVG